MAVVVEILVRYTNYIILSVIYNIHLIPLYSFDLCVNEYLSTLLTCVLMSVNECFVAIMSCANLCQPKVTWK